MKSFFHSVLKVLSFISFSFLLLLNSEVKAQSFSQNNINFNGKGTINNGTSLTFGPDGRLYVTEYVGVIKIFTLERNGPGDYLVTEMEELTGIQSIQDYNDDGSLYSSTMRETIGIVVSGTAANPIVYVSSSDFRIGGGGGGGSGDVGLDTNSGIITRFSWKDNNWEVVDIVRGLPRSEENHATNGLDIATVNGEEYLIVGQGGHTNAGAPSTNFAYTTEYALSAAILSVNLTQLENMPILDDNGRKYIYDLPTLDDPTRSNINEITDPDDPSYDGIDVNDPFGGNDGLNQAMIVEGGPVQIFSPGYRNAYDLVVTEKGAVFVTDNGANGGWGGFPVNEGSAQANNDYDPNEPGSSSTPPDGEKINNKDHLTMVTLDIQNYTFGSFYGGHPTPVRANPFGAGLYTNPSVTGTDGAVFRTLIYHPNKNTNGFTSDPNVGLPANWPPVSYANPDEGDWRGPDMNNPDGVNDVLVTSWGTNTNGIAEYTATNFDGAMKGDLISGVNTGELRRVELNEDGTLKNFTPSFASGLGGDALGVTCNSDSQIFPGTIWVVTLNGNLIVLEPQDFGICLAPGETGYEPEVDYDLDGYLNQDEIDNESDHCNGGSQPNDFDKSAGGILISDLNDLDDDNDGIPDAEDPFQLGGTLKTGSDAFALPVINELFSSNPNLKGYMGLGLTGLMNNGDPNPNWLNWLDRRDDPSEPNPNDILGGAIGAMTMQMTSGTAYGNINSQEKGFQYGVQVNNTSGVFTITGGIYNFNDPLQLYGNTNAPNGELGIFMGDGTQSNYIKFVLTPEGIIVQQEISDVPQNPLLFTISENNRPQSGATFFFIVDPANGIIDLEYSFDAGARVNIGTVEAQGAVLEAIIGANKDLAVGLTGTSNAAGVELEGTWDYLNVTGSTPYVVEELPDIDRTIGSLNESINLDSYFNDDNGVENLRYSVANNSNSAIETVISGNNLDIIFPTIPAVSDITIRATDSDNLFVEQTFRVTVAEESISNILYRINTGGPAISSIDGELDWEADTSAENSPYLTEAGGNNTSSFNIENYTAEVDLSTTPTNIFNTERSDNAAGLPNVTYSFPVSEGSFEVRLYMGNGYHGSSNVGERIFNIAIEGVTYPETQNIDLSGSFGHQTGAVITKVVQVTDGFLDISLVHGQIENPLINGIEILGSSKGENPINVTAISDQFNMVGEELDGSLAVEASGGDGNLSYNITGAPAGIVIEPTNGQIGGTVDLNANNDSPYNVTVTVDDGDDHSNDAVNISFTWTISDGGPYIIQNIPDIDRNINSTDENINLNDFFDDNEGKENLVFTIENNSNPVFNVVVLDSTLTISFPSEPSLANITIRATDSQGNFVEQTFTVKVLEETAAPSVLYRVNSGGPAVVSIDGEIDWGADTGSENSPYLAEAAGNNTGSYSMKNYTAEVDLETTPTSIFNSERSDYSSGVPNITYSFPLDPGTYEVRLYMGNGYHGTSEAGERLFNVEMENTLYPELESIDISGTFGHKTGAVITKTLEVSDGSLDISFIHGSIENPLISGIEILGSSSTGNPIIITAIADQNNIIGDELDGSLAVSATGGEGTLSYSISGAPEGVSIDQVTGIISGKIDLIAAQEEPYLVTVSVNDSAEESVNEANISFNWNISTGAPIIVATIPNLQRFVGDDPEIIDLSAYFDDNDGVENLVFTVEGNTDPNLEASIENNLLTLTFPVSAIESQITIRATDALGNNTEQSFLVTISEASSGTPIVVTQIEDQQNIAGDVLDESLIVVATGGDGALKHTILGAPQGIDIDPVSGIISGTIATNASEGSPYQVTVTVDDEDIETVDAVSTSFTWSISSGNPFILQSFSAIERLVGAADDSFDLTQYFDDNDGVENLSFSVEENTSPGIVATISANILNLSYPSSPVSTSIVIRATDILGNFVEQTFTVTVLEEVAAPSVLYRVNSGGPAIASIDGEIDWGADTGSENSPYLAEAAGNNTGSYNMKNYTAEVDLETTPTSIFNSERSDHSSGTPNITYSFPLDPGAYEVRLYMGNGYHGTSKTGQRIFNVELENTLYPELESIDISGTFGHKTGAVIAKTLEVSDGFLDISFIHGSIENPLISGIEILSSSPIGNPIIITEIADQNNIIGDELDGSLAVSATGGEGSLLYSMSGAPAGVSIDAGSGVLNGIIGMEADILSPYNVLISVSDNNGSESSIQFSWIVNRKDPVAMWYEKFEDQNYTSRHECSFVQAGDKFYLMGGRESAKDIDVYDYKNNSWSPIIDSAPFEFNHFQATEYQGLIWVIGAFKTNNFPSEIPTEYIWIFNPGTQEWMQGPSIPQNRRRGSTGVVIYNDKFYISGGNTLGHDGGFVSWFDEYDPATGTWTPLVDAPSARDHFHSAVIGDKLYLAGGRLSGGTGGTFKPLIPQVDVYDFATSTWSTLPVDLPTPRAAASVVNFENKLVVIGGEVSNEEVDGVVISDALDITEEYDPASGLWKRIASLNHKRHGTQAIVSGDGVYVTAGSPSLGGGNQKNMEFMGSDNPQGEPIISSSILVPDAVELNNSATKEIAIEVVDGNSGVFITSVELQGLYAENFQIVSGNLDNALLKSNSVHIIHLDYLGSKIDETANLIINYGLSSQKIIGLSSTDSEIVINQIADQANFNGDILDGNLVVEATGGEGQLSYSIVGSPQGIDIDPVSGIISGTIVTNASEGSPYQVTVTVDDEDIETVDAVSTSFTWSISSGNPFILQSFSAIERLVGAADDSFDLTQYFDDNDGVENLSFSVEENTSPGIVATISANFLNLSYPSSPVSTSIVIRATDILGNFVEQTFTVTVLEEVAAPSVLYRVNSGGPAIASIDGEIDWGADTGFENSPYLAEAAGNNTGSYNMKNYTAEVDLETTPTSIFNSERSDHSSGTPNITYSFPLDPGTYEVRLYMGNGYHGTSKTGQRIFNVELENTLYPELEGIDISGTFGHKTGAVITKTLEVNDGVLDISFIHGSIENPLINGIEILGSSTSKKSITVQSVDTSKLDDTDKTMEVHDSGESLDSSLQLTAYLFPNPSINDVQLKISNPLVDLREIIVYSSNGRLVKIIDARRIKIEEDLYNIGLTGFPNGIYIMKLNFIDADSINLRLVKR